MDGLGGAPSEQASEGADGPGRRTGNKGHGWSARECGLAFHTASRGMKAHRLNEGGQSLRTRKMRQRPQLSIGY